MNPWNSSVYMFKSMVVWVLKPGASCTKLCTHENSLTVEMCRFCTSWSINTKEISNRISRTTHSFILISAKSGTLRWIENEANSSSIYTVGGRCELSSLTPKKCRRLSGPPEPSQVLQDGSMINLRSESPTTRNQPAGERPQRDWQTRWCCASCQLRLTTSPVATR